MPGPSELRPEPGRIVGRAAARDAFLRQEPAPHHESVAHGGAHRAVDLERQPHPVRARSAVAIVAAVQRGEKRRHGVGVGVVQLHAVESRLLGACRRLGEQSRQHPRQLADVRQVRVGDPLALAEPQALELPLVQEAGPLRLRQSRQRLADVVVRTRQQRAVPVGESQVLPEVSLRLGPAADPEEVDDLDEQPGASAARLTDGAHQLGQAGNESVVTDPKQRSARNVPDAGRLDHECPRLPACEALVPREDLRCDQPVVGGPPRHHGGDPGALRQLEPAGAERAEPERPRRFLRGGWMRRRNGMLDEGLGMPHIESCLRDGPDGGRPHTRSFHRVRPGTFMALRAAATPAWARPAPGPGRA